MNDFLNYVAERKYTLYRRLHISRPGGAYTTEECFERIQTKERYEEILQIINFLPINEQKKVNERYEELRGI